MRKLEVFGIQLPHSINDFVVVNLFNQRLRVQIANVEEGFYESADKYSYQYIGHDNFGKLVLFGEGAIVSQPYTAAKNSTERSDDFDFDFGYIVRSDTEDRAIWTTTAEFLIFDKIRNALDGTCMSMYDNLTKKASLGEFFERSVEYLKDQFRFNNQIEQRAKTFILDGFRKDLLEVQDIPTIILDYLMLQFSKRLDDEKISDDPRCVDALKLAHTKSVSNLSDEEKELLKEYGWL